MGRPSTPAPVELMGRRCFILQMPKTHLSCPGQTSEGPRCVYTTRAFTNKTRMLGYLGRAGIPRSRIA